MIKYLLLIAAITFLHLQGASQITNLSWNSFDEASSKNDDNRTLIPEKYRALELSYNDVVLQLSTLSLDKQSSLNISLPLPDGSFENFSIQRNDVLPEELAKKFPGLGTYSGTSMENTGRKVSLDISAQGFHAMIIGGNGTIFIDPYFSDSNQFYLSYFRKDFQRKGAASWSCDAHGGQDFDLTKSMMKEIEANLKRNRKASLVQKRYRLAVATTGEYTGFFGGTLIDGLSAVMTAINRVSGIYEFEVGVRLNLIPNNDLIVFTNPGTDPFNNSSNDLNVVQGVIDNVIGSANYDVGHVFTNSSGGVAFLGVVCNNASKARGLTGLSNPTGDPFYVDYVAHELGHQFAATHTFNGDSNACAGSQRTASTAYEPGSGATIMAYAGICGNDNLQNNSDAYFHLASLQQITNHINGSAAVCAQNVDFGNNMPTADANSEGIDGKVIPANTPFELIGDGSDPDGDNLLYQWDQWDLGPRQDVSAGDNGSSPIFRSFFYERSNTRIFPRIDDILNNTTTIGMTLPTTNRDLDFRLIVRDGEGGWMDDEISISVVNSAGPFVVTSQNGGGAISGLTTIDWDVAGTDANGINCTNVDILLSVDGGYSFPIVLAEDVANDGSHDVTIPNSFTSTARIKVKCSDNIFFDINDSDLTIGPGTLPCNVVGTLSDDPILDGTYSSATDLLTDGRVPDMANVVFTGTTGIEYLLNFEAEDGGLLQAVIQPCTN